MTAAIDLMEVSPRDGLQDHPVRVPTEVKVELIGRAVAAGLTNVEIASFAHPARVPQMADAEAVIAACRAIAGLTPVALVLNDKGLDRALAAGIADINMVVVVTETFARRNQGVGVGELVASCSRIARRAAAYGVRASVTVSAAFGCPYEGDVPAAAVLEVVKAVLEAGPAAVTLADTIGAGVPTMVEDLVGAVVGLGGAPVRGHFHDTRNTGVANAVAALGAGAVGLDASLGGLGGCPFAPGATGNVATEDVVWALHRMGIETGASLTAVLDTVAWMGEHFAVEGRRVGGAVFRAGPFPRR